MNLAIGNIFFGGINVKNAVFAVTANESVGRLFFGGVIPGLILAARLIHGSISGKSVIPNILFK